MKREGGELARSVLPVWIIDDVSDILGFHLLSFALCPNDRIIRLRLTLAVSITARFGHAASWDLNGFSLTKLG